LSCLIVEVVAPQLPEVADAVGDAFHVVVHAAIGLGCKGTKKQREMQKKKGFSLAFLK
jgi:hypothetical protein